MCEVTPHMEATTACHGISLIYHCVALLISTSSVVHIYTYTRMIEKNKIFKQGIEIALKSVWLTVHNMQLKMSERMILLKKKG